MIMNFWLIGPFPTYIIIIIMLMYTNFLSQGHNSKGYNLHRVQQKVPPEVYNMAISMEYFPYARHQSDLHAISHFIIMSNHVVGISIFVSWIRKPMGIESLKIFAYGNTTNKLQKQDSNSRL